jgi:transcriptional regulator with XRE-family HTH domain
MMIIVKRWPIMSAIEKRIGGKITEIRLERKLTQPELAEKINVSVETISRMERGVTFPSLKTVEKISKTLDVPLKTFFDFDEFQSKDKSFERELSKLIAFLRTLREEEITMIYKILKVVFKTLKLAK